MRFSIKTVVVAVLMAALAMSHFVLQAKLRMQIRAFEEKEEERESLEDPLERQLVDSLTTGDLLGTNPYYMILVDKVVTPANPEMFNGWAKMLAELDDSSPSAFVDCEFHLFRFREGRDYTIFAVIVREDRCVKVMWIGAEIKPV
ncbi:hypothetical protein [Planctomycetes bacterium TBK1r]